MRTPEEQVARVRAVLDRYPDAWRQVEQMRGDQGRALPNWPGWCYLPLAGAYAVVSAVAGEPVPPADCLDISRVGALAAWRVTQGIYEYDATLAEALMGTQVAGDLPVDVLHQLPEWCVYIRTPGPQIELPGGGETQLHGYYAHMEWDANDGHEELRLLLDLTSRNGSDLLHPIPLHLGRGSILGALEAAAEYGARQAQVAALLPGAAIGDIAGMAQHMTGIVEPLVSLVLYLCAQSSDVRAAGTGQAHPRRPPRRYPEAPVAWSVGHRLGAAMRAYVPTGEERAGLPAGTHASPRPHWRRAHWHHYLVGPRQTEQTRVLRWIPPVPVNVEDDGELPAVVYRVR